MEGKCVLKKKQITCVDCSEIYNRKQHIILILKELECKNINKNIINLENRIVLWFMRRAVFKLWGPTQDTKHEKQNVYEKIKVAIS